MFGIGAGSGQSEPDDIHAILGMDFTNAGISGTWTAENLAGTAPFTTPLATRLAVDPSKIVVMNYGINDSHEVTLDEYEQNLFDWVRTVRSFGKIPVFEEPNPSSIASFQAVLPAYVAAMDRAAQQLNVPIVPQYYRMQQIPNWQALLSDGLHPNAQGYAVKAQETAAVLKTVIASIQ
jgi:lysophospholipase L1-like esterase